MIARCWWCVRGVMLFPKIQAACASIANIKSSNQIQSSVFILRKKRDALKYHTSLIIQLVFRAINLSKYRNQSELGASIEHIIACLPVTTGASFLEPQKCSRLNSHPVVRDIFSDTITSCTQLLQRFRWSSGMQQILQLLAS